jgi:predicted aspartyl protease
MHGLFRLAGFLLASFSVALLLAPAGVRADNEAAALLAKHRAFVGWSDGDGTFTSWRLTMTIGSGETKSTTTEVRRGALYHDALGNGDLSSDEGYNGRFFWSSDQNGNAVTHYEDEARLDLSVNALFNEATSGLNGVSRGSGKVGNLSVDIVRVTPPSGFPIDLYIDSDGAYRRAVVATVARPIEIDIDKYFEASPGKKIIGLFHFGTGQPYEVVKLEPNIPVSDEELLPPSPRTNWDFKTTDSIAITVTKDSYVGGAVRLLASINGHEGLFLLDSGASVSLVFRPFADAVEGESVGASLVGGVGGGTVKTTKLRVKDISIGKNTLHNVILQTSYTRSKPDYDGILGYDLLARAIVEVDLVSKRLTILDPAHFTPTIQKGAAAFAIDLFTRSPRAHILVGNGIDVKPIFDTGNSFGVLLSERLRTTGKLIGTVTGYQPLFGIDGRTNGQAACSRIERMQVGPYRYENAQACFGDPSQFDENDGLLGFDFLKHFNWTFDYPHGRLILTPNGMN